MVERFKIILLCVVGAIVYGIVHDQITARICLEYFTEFHPPILNDTHDPTLLGLGWGVIATWWVGFGLGVPLSICATLGTLPKVRARDLVGPVGTILLILGCCAIAAGLVGYWLSDSGRFILPLDISDYLAPDMRPRFTADWFAHLTSYGLGALLEIVLCCVVLRRRYREAKKADARGTPQVADNRG